MKKLLLILLCFPLLSLGQTAPLDLENYEQYMPTSSCGEIIHYSYYSVSFCDKYKLSEWTIHYLTPDRLGGKQERTNDFRQDPRLNGRDASLSDFKRSVYDRGHLVPAADLSFDSTRMSETFFMTNMSPQTASFNRGGWKQVESRIRDWVHEFDTVAIITGFVTGDYPIDIIDYIGDSVAVPKYFYKVFIDIQGKRSLAFLMPNERITGDIYDYLITIKDLENITGLDFFYKVDDMDEIIFEMNPKKEIIK